MVQGRTVKPKAVVFDIDGTVALRDKGPDGRGPFDWDRVGEDLPNEPVLAVARALSPKLYRIFLSGRDEVCRNRTIAWLDWHLGDTDYHIIMRARKDNRPDHVIKPELMREAEAAWEIVAIFDDRNSVVDEWRVRGYTCFQVCSREAGDF